MNQSLEGNSAHKYEHYCTRKKTFVIFRKSGRIRVQKVRKLAKNVKSTKGIPTHLLKKLSTEGFKRFTIEKSLEMATAR
jgi:hypothetical protein